MTPLMTPANVSPVRPVSKQAAHASVDFPLGVGGDALAAVALFGGFQQLVSRGQGTARIEAENIAQGAVVHKVGVASDGRGEMTVARRAEAEMSVFLGRVAGLHHGAQGKAAHHEGLIRACGRIQHMGEPAGNRGLGRPRQGQIGVGGAQGVR